MTLINGADKAEYGDLGASTSYFGNGYQAISVVFLPELNSGNPLFTVFFDADEKKGNQGGYLYADAGAIECTGKSAAGCGEETGYAISGE